MGIPVSHARETKAGEGDFQPGPIDAPVKLTPVDRQRFRARVLTSDSAKMNVSKAGTYRDWVEFGRYGLGRTEMPMGVKDECRPRPFWPCGH
jgi:hypothetical protein